jgi:hypothetical protein
MTSDVTTVERAVPLLTSTSPFDYAELDPEIAEGARAAAEEINTALALGCKAYLVIGAALRRMKASLGHGHFLPWLRAETSISERSADRYMAAAEMVERNSPLVANLNLRTLEALATAPEGARAKLLARIEAGEPVGEDEIRRTTRELKKLARTDDDVTKTPAKQQLKAADRLNENEQRPTGWNSIPHEEVQEAPSAGSMALGLWIAEHVKKDQQLARVVVGWLRDARTADVIAAIERQLVDVTDTVEEAASAAGLAALESGSGPVSETLPTAVAACQNSDPWRES